MFEKYLISTKAPSATPFNKVTDIPSLANSYDELVNSVFETFTDK